MTQDQLTYIAETVGEMKGRLDDLYHELRGNGQPGFIADTRKRLSELEHQARVRKWAGRVMYAAFSTVLTLLIAFKDRIFRGAH